MTPSERSDNPERSDSVRRLCESILRTCRDENAVFSGGKDQIGWMRQFFDERDREIDKLRAELAEQEKKNLEGAQCELRLKLERDELKKKLGDAKYFLVIFIADREMPTDCACTEGWKCLYHSQLFNAKRLLRQISQDESSKKGE